MKATHTVHKHSHYSEQITVFLSFLCAVHCVATPFLVLFLPMAATFFEQYHWLEYIIVLSVFLLGTSSILHGYKEHHQNKIPAYIFFGGLILLASASVTKLIFGLHNETHHFLSAIGGIACGIGQFYNLKLSSK